MKNRIVSFYLQHAIIYSEKPLSDVFYHVCVGAAFGVSIFLFREYLYKTGGSLLAIPVSGLAMGALSAFNHWLVKRYR